MKYLPAVFCLFFLLTPSVFSQSEIDFDSPTWLMMNSGIDAYNQGDFGGALQYFRAVLEKEGTYPEADIWIGKVFEIDGEIQLAIKQYEKALANSSQLEILEQKYQILYELAELYKTAGNNLKYEEKLQQILDDDEIYASADVQALMRVLKEKGFDSVIQLYRYQNDFSQSAHFQLGEFYFRSGRYLQAIEHCIFAVMYPFSKSISYIRDLDPVYAYENGAEFFKACRLYPETVPYFSSSKLFEGMFFLGASLYTAGEIGEAEYLWDLVSRFSQNNQLKELIRSQSRN